MNVSFTSVSAPNMSRDEAKGWLSLSEGLLYFTAVVATFKVTRTD